MAPDQRREVAPAPDAPQVTRKRGCVDGVVGDHLGGRHVRRPRVAGAEGEVRVLPDEDGLVEAVEPLEERARVEDVAGLGPGHRRLDLLRLALRSQRNRTGRSCEATTTEISGVGATAVDYGGSPRPPPAVSEVPGCGQGDC